MPPRRRRTPEENEAERQAKEARVAAREARRAEVEARRIEQQERRAQRELGRPHVAEWFGHRVFPEVASHPIALADQRSQRCPFLSRVAEKEVGCIKAQNGRGVCTISAGSNGPRQDWLVCPHRALDDDLLHAMVRRLFDMAPSEELHVLPSTNLNDHGAGGRLVDSVNDPSLPRQFITFQQYFGGEIGLSKTAASPEFSFDTTVVEVVPDGAGGVGLGRYGVIEMQTTDTHGSYAEAVGALRTALDLHGSDFAAEVAKHPDWPARKVEGPNISNVFKRTFYQVMFKFQITRRASSAGCILAVPRPVWDSWQPFLGAPRVVPVGDGTHALVARDSPATVGERSAGQNWIYVFDIAEKPPADGSTTPVDIHLIVSTDAPTLSALALDVAPTQAIGDAFAEDSVLVALRRRLGVYMPGIH